MGASALYRILGELGANVPRVRTDQARALYERVSHATAAGWVASCHDLSEGGLAVALAESAMGGRLGCRISIDAIAADIGECAALYSESHSRFVATVPADSADLFENLLGDCAVMLGEVTANPQLLIESNGGQIVDAPLARLIHAWGSRLVEVL